MTNGPPRFPLAGLGIFLFFLFYGSISRICAAEKFRGSVSERALPCSGLSRRAEQSRPGTDARLLDLTRDCAAARWRDVQRASLHLLAHQQRVRDITAAGFASKASSIISNVCLGLRLQTCSTHWPGWPLRLPSGLFSMRVCTLPIAARRL
jgi:hypothetical protein